MLFLSNFFKICFLSCLFSLIACSNNKAVTPEELRVGALKAQQISEKFGVINDQDTLVFLDYLEHRLANSLPPEKRRGLNFRFTLLNTDQPIALSPGAGEILFSRGLVVRLQSEAELAFVLAHELAHQHLGHTKPEVIRNIEDLADVHSNHTFEYEADRYALGHIALAGYDPRVSIKALLHSYGRARANVSHPSHPGLWSRIEQLKLALRQSTWSPPGTVNRRAYNKFRRYVHELS